MSGKGGYIPHSVTITCCQNFPALCLPSQHTFGVLALNHYNARQVPTSSHCTGTEAYEERIACSTPAGVPVASLHVTKGTWTTWVLRTSEVVPPQKWFDTVASHPVILQVSAEFQSLSGFYRISFKTLIQVRSSSLLLPWLKTSGHLHSFPSSAREWGRHGVWTVCTNCPFVTRMLQML